MSKVSLQRSRRRQAQQGFSLVELLVAAIIGIVVLGVVASLYIANRKVFQFQESYSRLQEAGRFTMDTLGREVRNAGYTGCGGLATMSNILAKDATGKPYWWLDTDRMVWGYDQGAAVPTELANTVSDSDILILKYRGDANEAMITGHDLANKRFTVGLPHTYEKGSVLVATDCVHASVFRMSNANTGSVSTIEYASGVIGGSHDNTADTLSAVKYSTGGSISPLVTNAYYIMASNDPALVDTPDPCPSSDASFVRRVLVVRTLSGSSDGNLLAPRPLVCDVETLQLSYGVDNDSDLSADQFMSAGALGTDPALWQKVVSVRVDILVVNPKLNTADADVAQCLDYNGGAVSGSCPATASTSAGSGYGYRWAGQGKRSAKVFSSTFSLRNRAS